MTIRNSFLDRISIIVTTPTIEVQEIMSWVMLPESISRIASISLV